MPQKTSSLRSDAILEVIVFVIFTISLIKNFRINVFPFAYATLIEAATRPNFHSTFNEIDPDRRIIPPLNSKQSIIIGGARSNGTPFVTRRLT